MVDQNQMNLDTRAVILLCGQFGVDERDGSKPLTTSEYNRFASWLRKHDLRPADLLETQVDYSSLDETRLEPQRIESLLERSVSMGMALEKWSSEGIWVISRSDEDYPARWENRLKGKRPPLLYGIGERRLLQDGGLAVVGSRDADQSGLDACKLIGEGCAGSGITVISGDARGVDQAAMRGTLDAGGSAVGILADGLSKQMRQPHYRDVIRDGRLALVTAFGPQAPYHHGFRMARNAQIYALADWALVISSGLEEGGTWAGATENLKNQWVPLFVREPRPQPPGNQKLIERGGISLSLDDLAGSTGMRTSLEQLRQSAQPSVEPVFAVSAEDEIAGLSPADRLYEAFWRTVAPYLTSARKESEIRAYLEGSLQVGQIQKWLKRAREEGRVERLTGPVRYQALEPAPCEAEASDATAQQQPRLID